MDLFTVARVILSLAVVFGIIWYAHRRITKGKPKRAVVPVSVVGRAALGNKAHAVIVDTGGKRMVLGVTEHGVTVLDVSETPDVSFERALADAEITTDTTAATTAKAAPAAVAPPFAFGGDKSFSPFRDAFGNPVTWTGFRAAIARILGAPKP